MFIVNLLAALLITNALTTGPSFSQTPTPTPQATLTATPSPQAQELNKDLLEKKAAECACAKPASDAIQKAYASLEEDEWSAAIKSSTDTLNSINTLSAKCKCPEVAIYQNVAKAFLNYAKGGNLLDGEDNPDCKKAKELYDTAISLLKDSIPKITNQEVKTNTTNIKEYAEEELQFVKDECEESVPTKKSTGDGSPKK